MAAAQGQPHLTRGVELRGRRARRPAGLRVGCVRRQRRDGRRSPHHPAVAARRRFFWLGWCSSTCSTASAPTPPARWEVAEARPSASTWSPPRSRSALSTRLGPDRPRRHEGLPLLRVRRSENCTEIPHSRRAPDPGEEYREKLMDEVSETSDLLHGSATSRARRSRTRRSSPRSRTGTNHRPTCFRPPAAWPRATLAPVFLDAHPRPPSLAGQTRLASMSTHVDPRRGPRNCSPTCSGPAPTRSPGGSTCSASTRG